MREYLINMSIMICNRCEYKSKKDDILLDGIIKPIFNMFENKKK